MNRTGLVIAVVVAAACVLLFTLYPQIDLELAQRYFDTASRSFPQASVVSAEMLRRAAMWIAWGFTVPAILALIAKLVWPQRPLLIGGRNLVFIIVTMILAAGIFSNGIFKSHWSRPRPVATQDFGGAWAFKPWWDPRGDCTRNCSFYSGEAATAFWTFAPAALAPIPVRPLAYLAATTFGLATGYWRMTFGGHYASDVIFAGIATFFIVWLTYWFIYRRATSRVTDEAVERTLTNLALAIRRRFRRSRA
jgi:membrane-associated PAP2 superfamily phosphatase